MKQQKNRGAFTEYIKEWVLLGMNFDLGIFGNRGSGKSWAAIKLAQIISRKFGRTFDKSHIHFRAKTFLTQLDDLERDNKLLPGMVFILDEAGIGMDAQNWWESEVKAVADEMETYRTYNLIVIFTSPMMNNITKRAREMLTGYLKPFLPQIKDRKELESVKDNILRTTKQSMWIFHRIEAEPVQLKSKTSIWRWHIRNSEGYLKRIKIGKPDTKTVNFYEGNKKIYLRLKRQRRIQELIAKDIENDEEVSIESIVTQIKRNQKKYIKKWRGKKKIKEGMVKHDFKIGKHRIKEIKDIIDWELNTTPTKKI